MKQVLWERMGMEAMSTETGMRTLYQALVSGHAQVMVLHGLVERTKQLLPLRSDAPLKAEPENLAVAPNRETWLYRLYEDLVHMVAHFLGVGIEEIDAETELSEYGFDSITFKTFANLLNQTYQLDLSSALFFEHSTLKRLAQYLQTTYAALLAPHFVTQAN